MGFFIWDMQPSLITVCSHAQTTPNLGVTRHSSVITHFIQIIVQDTNIRYKLVDANAMSGPISALVGSERSGQLVNNLVRKRLTSLG